IAAGKRINRGAIGGVDDENAADRRFAVVSNQCARSYHVDRMRLGTVEMDAMVAIMLGAGRQNVFLVERVHDEQHALLYRKNWLAWMDNPRRPPESGDPAAS